MAMYCTKCEKEIESQYATCQYCGYLNEKASKSSFYAGIIYIAMAILFSVFMLFINAYSGLFLGLIFFGIGIFCLNDSSKKSKKISEYYQKQNLKQPIISSITSAYNQTYTNITVPPNPYLIYLENSEHCNCWLDNATLYITTSLEKLTERINNNPDLYSIFLKTPYLFTLYQIPVENIEYFNVVGDFYVENRTSGGGSSLGGAIVGGMVAGNAGAVIGSRKGIMSETIKHDERIIELKYNENRQLKTVLLDKTAEHVLKQLIPEKEYSYIMFQRNRA